jgi:hypothetical protein
MHSMFGSSAQCSSKGRQCPTACRRIKRPLDYTIRAGVITARVVGRVLPEVQIGVVEDVVGAAEVAVVLRRQHLRNREVKSSRVALLGRDSCLPARSGSQTRQHEHMYAGVPVQRWSGAHHANIVAGVKHWRHLQEEVRLADLQGGSPVSVLKQHAARNLLASTSQ